MKKEKELQKRKWETEFERLRRERSWGTSFNRQGGGNSSDRRGTAVSTMGPMWTRGVSAAGGDLERVQRESETALRVNLERMKKEKELQIRRWETKFERLRRERSWDTSFDRQGGGNSADRRGTAVSTMGPMWTRGVGAAGGLRKNFPNFPRGIVPEFPVECSPSEYIAWEQRFEFFIADQDLRHTISPDASEIAVISCTNNAYLFGQFGEDLVLEHRRVWGYISEATADAPFEKSLYKCHSISDALRMMSEWPLPFYPAERHLLVAELERVQFMGDEEPEIVQFILRQFPERPSHPHALVVGCGLRDGGAWAAVACLGSSSSCGNTDLATVACLGSSSSCSNTGLVTVAYRGSSSSCNTGFTTVVYRGSSSSSSNGLAAVVTLIDTNVAPILFLPPGRRDSSRHGESIRQEMTGSTAGTPFSTCD